MTFRGLVVPIPTLFDARGGIDPDATTKFAQSLREAGVDRLFALGSLGEFPSVEPAERVALVEALVQAAPRAQDVWVGTGAPSTRQAIEYGRAAERAGASAIVVVPPYYLHPAEASIERYYREIHAAIPLPIYGYNIPSLVGYALSPSLVHRLGEDGVLAGLKDTSGSWASVDGFLRGAPRGFEIYPGDDPLAAPSIAAGASGAVMGLGNVLPKLARDLVRAAHARDAKEVARLQELIEALQFIVAGGPFPAAGKYLAQRVRGAPAGYRSPYDPLRPEEEARVWARWQAWETRLAEFR